MSDPLRVGVVGVGSMGENHARVYASLPDARLVGVADRDADRAAHVAARYDTDAVAPAALLEAADAVSVAVPTRAHADVVADCVDAGVHALVEKPFVADPTVGRALASEAATADVVLQPGHVERFNPAVRVLDDVLADADVVAVEARRLGPPLEREVAEGVVRDLMIHDVDVVCSLLDAPVESVAAAGRDDGAHATSVLQFGDGLSATLTASRVTQRKIRRLAVIAEDRYVDVDYLDQTVRIHRRSVPSYVREEGDVRYRHESVVERPLVEATEPLRAELSSFLRTVREGGTPAVTAAEGVDAVETVRRIEAAVRGAEEVTAP